MISSKTHEIMFTTPSHHRLIWSRPLSEGEEVLFFLADNRHTLMSRTSIGREGESIFQSHGLDLTYPAFENFAHSYSDHSAHASIILKIIMRNLTLCERSRKVGKWRRLCTWKISWKVSPIFEIKTVYRFRYLDSVRTKGVLTLALC